MGCGASASTGCTHRICNQAAAKQAHHTALAAQQPWANLPLIMDPQLGQAVASECHGPSLLHDDDARRLEADAFAAEEHPAGQALDSFVADSRVDANVIDAFAAGEELTAGRALDGFAADSFVDTICNKNMQQDHADALSAREEAGHAEEQRACPSGAQDRIAAQEHQVPEAPEDVHTEEQDDDHQQNQACDAVTKSVLHCEPSFSGAALNFTDAQMLQIQDMFGGSCSKSGSTPLQAMCLKQPMTGEQVIEILTVAKQAGMFTGVDALGFEDFLQAMSCQDIAKNLAGDVEVDSDECANSDLCLSTFELFDRNGDGFLCADEVVEVLQAWGEPHSIEAARSRIRAADLDGDSRLDYDEFKLLMRQLVPGCC